MSVTATARRSTQRVTVRPLIRPPDPAFDSGIGNRIGRYTSAQANRLLLHCFFRDAHTATDLTYGDGGGWKRPYPPGLAITTNNIDPTAPTDLHVDFTATGLPDAAYDLAVYDPPHLPHLGQTSFMARRYGTVRSTTGFRAMIEEGILEAWRISSVGIIVKLCDSPNGGAYLPVTSWAAEALGVWPVYVIHTIGRPSPRPKGEVGRVPRNNGADWLAFRKDGNRYPDFITRWERQEASQMAALHARRRCAMCDIPIGDRRGGARTCSTTCRKQAQRQRRAAR